MLLQSKAQFSKVCMAIHKCGWYLRKSHNLASFLNYLYYLALVTPMLTKLTVASNFLPFWDIVAVSTNFLWTLSFSGLHNLSTCTKPFTPNMFFCTLYGF